MGVQIVKRKYQANEPVPGESFFSLLPVIWKRILLSIFILIITVMIDYFAGRYVSERDGAVPEDLFLALYGPVDLGFLFTYGYIVLFFIVFGYAVFFRPRTVSYLMNQLSAIIFVRSIFICFTFLKNPPSAVPVSFPLFFSALSFENDLFFSGHTAVPFMFFLFYEEKLRWIFLAGSILLGAVALLMHRHYTIDVMAAFFIAYGTYRICYRLDNPEKLRISA